MTFYFLFVILKNLFFTVLIESIMAFLLGIRNIENIKIVSLANVITNTFLSLVSIILIVYYKNLYKKSLVFLEIIVIFIEAYIYNKNINIRNTILKNKFFKNKKFLISFLFSIILNTTTIMLSRFFK